MVDVFCTGCGNSLTSSDRFCRRCGKPVAPRPVSPSPSPGQPLLQQTQVNNSGANITKVIGGILVFLVVLLIRMAFHMAADATQSHIGMTSSASAISAYNAGLSGTYNTEDAIRLNGGGGFTFNPDGTFQMAAPSLDSNHQVYTGTYSISADVLQLQFNLPSNGQPAPNDPMSQAMLGGLTSGTLSEDRKSFSWQGYTFVKTN